MLVHPEIRKEASEQRGSTTVVRLHTTADLLASQRIILWVRRYVGPGTYFVLVPIIININIIIIIINVISEDH